MIRLGTFLIILGGGSMILHLTSYQFRLLSWAEPAQPWLGLIVAVIGIALVTVGSINDKKKASRNGGTQPVDAAPYGTPGFAPPPAAPLQYPTGGTTPGQSGPQYPVAPPQQSQTYPSAQQYPPPSYGQGQQPGQQR